MSHSLYPARHWRLDPDGRVCCELCPHQCRLKNGQRGRCFLRLAKDQALWLSAYGRVAGLMLDPIEKKPLYHFYPSSTVLSFGSIGCNLRCSFCQNWTISTGRDLDSLRQELSPREIAERARETGARSVAFTYNEPIIFFEFAIETARACHAKGLKSLAVTSGEILPAPRKEFFSEMDAANVDLKSFKEETYQKLCGGPLAQVLETLEYIVHQTRTWLEITTLLIPGINDSDTEIRGLSNWIHEHLGPDIPLHFTAFHPAHQMRNIPPTPLGTLLHARKLAKEAGLRHVYTGNIPDSESSASYCSSCGQLLISRKGYQTEIIGLDGSGRCSRCHMPFPGRF